MKKSHWIALLTLVVLAGIYIIARNKQPLEKEIRFFKADSAAIARLEFITTEDTVIVQKKGDNWQLTYPLAWDVNESQINSFFSQVLPIKTSTTPMSEDPALQKMYKVDEAGAVQVKIYDKAGKIIDYAYIGNGTNTSFDYGRKKDDNKIYQFSNNITGFVKPDIFQWRSPNITNLKQNEIDNIEVSYTMNSYKLTMAGDSIRYSDKNESFMIPYYNRAQYKIINALENLMTWQFYDKDTEQYATAFQKPECKITVNLKNKKTRVFTLIRTKNQKPDPLAAIETNEPVILMMIDNKITPLYQMTGDFINRFTRSSSHFKTQHD